MRAIYIFSIKTKMPGVTMIVMRICVRRFLNLKRSMVIRCVDAKKPDKPQGQSG